MTFAPELTADRTDVTAESEQAPRPPGPNAAKTDKRDADVEGTEEMTYESAPTEQPTARCAEEPDRTDETTDATSGCAETGSDREPQKPTDENKENIEEPDMAKAALRNANARDTQAKAVKPAPPGQPTQRAEKTIVRHSPRRRSNAMPEAL